MKASCGMAVESLCMKVVASKYDSMFKTNFQASR